MRYNKGRNLVLNKKGKVKVWRKGVNGDGVSVY